MNRRFEVLDAFRGLCALSVVVFHMRILDSVTEIEFFRGSYIFVEFFFVLSGFVLAHSYGVKDKVNFYSFMKARFLRIYPLHFVMFSVFVILELGKLFAYDFLGLNFNNQPFTGPFSVEEVIPNLLLIQSWTSLTYAESFNYPSWSISIELYSYAILAISIITFKKYRPVSWLALSLLSFFMLFSGSDIFVAQVQRGLSCFFGGAFTYVVFKKVENTDINYLLGSIIELLLITSIFFVVQSSSEYRGIVAPLLFLITVFSFSFEFGCISKLLKIGFLQYLGRLSYSIYMTHAAVLFCLTSISMVAGSIFSIKLTEVVEGVRFLSFGGGMINNLVILLTVLFVVYISRFTYKFVELRGQKLFVSTKEMKGTA